MGVTVKGRKVGFNTAQSTLLSQSTPIIEGSNQNQTLRGQNLGGILNGKGGHDQLSGMGGDDVVLGDDGNDGLNGGSGDDLLDGGKDSDTVNGGQGRDTFVIARGMGTDLIKDFQIGTDSIGLAGGLTFNDLTIAQTNRGAAIRAGREQLAILPGEQANQLSAQDFVNVDYTRFRGMAVPTLVA